MPENEVRKLIQASHPGASPVQPDHQQERLHDRSSASKNIEVWMRWEYSPDEWALFERIDWEPVNLRFWLLASLTLLLSSDIGLLIRSTISGNITMLILSILILLVWLLVLTIFLISTYRYGEARKRHRMRQRPGQAHSVTFSRQGLWEAGTYLPLNDLQHFLEKVSMTTKPAALHFSRTYHIGGKTTPQDDTLHIPVPGGHEQEAAELVQRFRTEVIQAREQAWQRLTNPPEPVERGL